MVLKIGVKGLVFLFFFRILKRSQRIGQVFIFLRIHLTALCLVHLGHSIASGLIKIGGLVACIVSGVWIVCWVELINLVQLIDLVAVIFGIIYLNANSNLIILSMDWTVFFLLIFIDYFLLNLRIGFFGTVPVLFLFRPLLLFWISYRTFFKVAFRVQIFVDFIDFELVYSKNYLPSIFEWTHRKGFLRTLCQT